MNNLGHYVNVMESLKAFEGYVPRGFLVDFVGTLIDANFRTMWGIQPDKEGGRFMAGSKPVVGQADPFFEAISWYESAKAASGSYTMITLGACYGGQAVGAYKMLKMINPMPVKLVAVEPDPENFVWLHKHFTDNGIDPKDHWMLNCALSATNKPVIFPAGSPGSGANDCSATNTEEAVAAYAEQISHSEHIADRLKSLLLNCDTGIDLNLVPGWNFPARLKLVSAVTVIDVISPFSKIDLLESDIQNTERTALPPAIDLIKQRVKMLHLGTHSFETHDEILQMLAKRRFEIIFSYYPSTPYETEYGSFHTQDGTITARNLDL